MSSKNAIKVPVIIIASIAIFAVAFLAPKNHSVAKIAENLSTETKNSIALQVDEIKASLPFESLTTLNSFEVNYRTTTSSEKVQWLDSIIQFWDKQMRPAVSAIYAEEKADLTQNIEDRNLSGYRYLNITDFLKPEDKTWAFDKAYEAFRKVLEKDPQNTDAKISLGICMVESGSFNPMDGILLIREVLEVEPTNTRAILQLGHFSIQSGQYENAIERYKQAYFVDTTQKEMFFYVGDTYAKMGNLDSANHYLSVYKSSIDNPVIKQQLENYIQEINIKSNH